MVARPARRALDAAVGGSVANKVPGKSRQILFACIPTQHLEAVAPPLFYGENVGVEVPLATLALD